ncbi:MAG: rRNA maturation RNase YbeY [Cytophagaceae bacterium SCN 52-12]|nr:MAG: rRNA maturation RNase YbeY [Cytophagaceae bacterium SCN 52-12]
MGTIQFFTEDISHKLVSPVKTKQWIRSIIEAEGFTPGTVNYVLCSDEYLLEMNRQYLEHDYYTDILTFDNSESETEIEGDIFISMERVLENAGNESVSPDVELRRVLAHGVLHLCGYDDHAAEEKATMRKKEDYYLSLF